MKFEQRTELTDSAWMPVDLLLEEAYLDRLDTHGILRTCVTCKRTCKQAGVPAQTNLKFICLEKNTL